MSRGSASSACASVSSPPRPDMKRVRARRAHRPPRVARVTGHARQVVVVEENHHAVAVRWQSDSTYVTPRPDGRRRPPRRSSPRAPCATSARHEPAVREHRAASRRPSNRMGTAGWRTGASGVAGSRRCLAACRGDRGDRRPGARRSTATQPVRPLSASVNSLGMIHSLLEALSAIFGQRLQVLVGEELVVGVSDVDGVEHRLDRLRLALCAQNRGLLCLLRP